MKTQDLEAVLDGVLFFHSETGTEGGFWAFQDSRYIQNNGSSGNLGDLVEQKNSFEGEQEEIEERWDYKGLHILQNGDYVTIYHPENKKEIWSGKIHLKEYELFTEFVTDDGFDYWIHADQLGIDRSVWAEYFFKEFPAKLKPVK